MKNNYRIENGQAYVEIFCKKKRMETVVSLEDLEIMKKHKGRWYAWYSKDNDTYYVCRWFYDKEGKLKVSYLHREIMGSPKGKVTDHVNHDTLDNRRSNLRIITHAQNQQNRKGAQRGSRSGVRGVSWESFTGRWKAQLRLNGKNYNFGRYNTIEEAEKVITQKRKELMEFTTN